MRTSTFRSGTLVLLLWIFSTAGFGQEKYASLNGVVNDTTDAVLPSVSVTLTNKATGRTATTMTGAEGIYVLRNVEPGRYSVTFRLRGFSDTEVSVINLLLGQTLKLDVRMEISGVTNRVDVTDIIPLIDTTSTVIAHNITVEEFDHLPKARNSQSLATLAPSVNSGEVEGGIQVAGASSAENSYTIDGFVTNSVINGWSRQDALLDYVQEVQIKTNGINAEYGGALGGVVSAVTRSGGNAFHGLGYYYGSSDRFVAGPAPRLVLSPIDDRTTAYFQDTKAKRSVREVGGSLGGPLVRDRVWFFISGSPRFTDRDQAYGFSNGTDPGTISQNQHALNAFTKLSFDPGDKVRMTLTWLYSPVYSTGTLPGYNGFGVNSTSSSKASNDINKARGFSQPQTSYTGNADFTLSNNSLFSARGGYYWDDYHDVGFPTTVSATYFKSSRGIAGVPADKQGDIGFQNTPAFLVTGHDLTTRTFGQADYSLSGDWMGFHNLKAGIGIQKTVNNVESFFPGGYINVWWGEPFTSTVTRQTSTGQYGYYEWNDYRVQGSAGASILSFYAQDQWTIHNRLTVNLGLRSERETIPSFRRAIQDPAIQFGFAEKMAPRLGASYDLKGDGRIKLYGSWGRYFDWTKYQVARNEFGGVVWSTKYRSLDTTDVFNLAANGLPGRDLWNPSVPGSFRNRSNPAFSSIDPQLKPMSQDNLAVGMDYQWRPEMVVSFQYLHNNLRRTIEDLGTIISGDNAYVITNPGEGYGTYMDPSGTATQTFSTPRAKRQYDAFQVSLDRRFSQRWFGNINYTYSRLYGNYSGLVDTDEIRTPTTGISYATSQQQSGVIAHPGTNDNRSWDAPEIVWDSHGHLDPRGALATDRPHVLKAYGSYALGFGPEIGVNYYVGSGTPVTTYVWDINSVPVFPEGRGDLGRTPLLSQTDMVVAYEKHLPGSDSRKVRFEFNMLNVFNQKTARHVFNDYNRQRASSEIDFATTDLAKGYDYKALIQTSTSDKALSLDPRFKMNDLFNPGFAGRFGVKFVF